ncbi:sugar ABC transporter ATP-binding protein [Patulibacter sp. NPDC049589]|uniref:sugar ABC transporter ATP-binding protein n=1 Tax=Patulibacter sp. NPDC049589 TaxID=3154731 RepID=UPI0034485A82
MTGDDVSQASLFVEARGLSKAYPGVQAAQGVDFAVSRGEIVGLVGPNGAGKSTLIKMLAGAVIPDEGTISVSGAPVVIDRPSIATGLGLAFVHQERSDVPNLSVAENVQLGLGFPKRQGRIDRGALKRNAVAVLDRLGARMDPEALASSLSVVDQRLLTIARGIAADAQMIVLDEPSASLTADEIEMLHDVLRRLAAQGTAVVYVSHRLDEITALTDRVVVMRGGRVTGAFPTAGASTTKLIEHITGVPEAARVGVTRASLETQRQAMASADSTKLLDVRGLSRAGIVEDASFSLAAGEVLGLAGMVGAGRSELMRLIYGADRATGGEILVDGEAVTIKSPRDALRAGIVLLPEDRRRHGLILEQSIRQNMTLPAIRRFRRVPGLPVPSLARERRAAVEQMSDLAVRAPSPETVVGTLSGGNQQKVVLAKWLIHGARVFIFDEPTLGVDVSGKRELYARMEKLAAQGHGVIFVSSEFEELVETCSRVLVMREGRLTGEVLAPDISVAGLVSRCYADRAAA